MMRAFGWISYQVALGLGLLVSAPLLGARRGGLGHYLPTLRGRLGRDLGAADGRPRLWIHAVSVGEAGVAATLVRHLPEDLPLVVTTVTPTGQAQARKTLGDRADVAYLPFDLSRPLERFLARFDPRALILVEGDYWPLALAKMAERGPIAVVNGRLSDRAFSRQRRLGRVNRLFYRHVSRFGLQTEDDRRRLEALGADPSALEVTGNLKFDAPEPPPKPALEEALRRLAAGRPILVAGSTMEGEDAAVLDAHAALGDGAALLVLAPRHPERWDAVAELIAARGVGWTRRSRLDLESEPKSETGPRVDIVLLDSLGELAGLYRLARAAFIGGTLVATGGHNPLEPARFGVATVVGPSMTNFQDMARLFDDAGAWRRATDAAGLAESWRRFAEDPEAARAVGERALDLVSANRGALGRTLETLEPVLAAVPREKSS